MNFRISPLWWPLFPFLIPLLTLQHRRFCKDAIEAEHLNAARLNKTVPMQMPALDFLKITPLVEQERVQGFLGAPGVSYWIETDQGQLLFDLGFGPQDDVLAHNADKLGFRMDCVDAVVISHRHPDHMGGFKAYKHNIVQWPEGIGPTAEKPIYLTARTGVSRLKPLVVDGPQPIQAGMATTGPLARSLFFMGQTEEQALVARIRGKGLVIITGCGHPRIEKIIEMVRRMSDLPVYAIIGGLHFPVTDSRLRKFGLKLQTIWGTGKPPWKKLGHADLTETIRAIKKENPRHVLISAHDSCDVAIQRFVDELPCSVQVLKAGGSYCLKR